MGTGMIRRLAWLLAAIALLGGAGFWYARQQIAPAISSVVASSLESLHEQNRLTAFAARFVTVVTSRKGLYGLNAEKTLIVPGMVRYEVDLAKLKQKDLRWDAATQTLRVTLPPIEIAGPEFDLGAIREYQSGAVLMALTDAERQLDAQNRAKAQADMIAQARAEPMLRLARDASQRAIERSFALPLAAAGIEGKVIVGF